MNHAKGFFRAAFLALAAAALLVSCHDVTLSRKESSGLSVRLDLGGVLRELYGGGV